MTYSLLSWFVDGDLGSEEENSGEEEDLSVLADDAGTVQTSDSIGSKKSKRKKKAENGFAPRYRKKNLVFHFSCVPEQSLIEV